MVGASQAKKGNAATKKRPASGVASSSQPPKKQRTNTKAITPPPTTTTISQLIAEDDSADELANTRATGEPMQPRARNVVLDDDGFDNDDDEVDDTSYAITSPTRKDFRPQAVITLNTKPASQRNRLSNGAIGQPITSVLIPSTGPVRAGPSHQSKITESNRQSKPRVDLLPATRKPFAVRSTKSVPPQPVLPKLVPSKPIPSKPVPSKSAQATSLLPSQPPIRQPPSRQPSQVFQTQNRLSNADKQISQQSQNSTTLSTGNSVVSESTSVSPFQAPTVFTRDERESFRELERYTRQVLLAWLDVRRRSEPIRLAFPSIEESSQLYTAADTLVKQNFKAWRNRTISNAKQWIKEWVELPENAQAAKIRSFGEFKHHLSEQVQLHWLFAVFKFAEKNIDLRRCTTLAMSFLKWSFVMLTSVARFDILRDRAPDPEMSMYAKYNDAYMRMLFDNASVRTEFQSLRRTDFPLLPVGGALRTFHGTIDINDESDAEIDPIILNGHANGSKTTTTIGKSSLVAARDEVFDIDDMVDMSEHDDDGNEDSIGSISNSDEFIDDDYVNRLREEGDEGDESEIHVIEDSEHEVEG